LEILINDRFQLLPHSYNFLTKVRNFESLIFESVSVGSVMEQVLPQIQEAILDQKAGSYRNWAPTQSWGLGKLQFYSLLFGILILDQRAGSHRNRRKRWGTECFQYSHSFQCALRVGDRHEAIFLYLTTIVVVFRKQCSHIICNLL
jgi:hypothetical protein